MVWVLPEFVFSLSDVVKNLSDRVSDEIYGHVQSRETFQLKQ